ncbi:hypothetical protein Tco_1454702 [Tanacetum coccineum]
MMANYHSAGSVVDTTLTHALLPATTMVGQDIRPRNAELHLILQAKEDLKPKEDRVVMLLASDAVKRAITRTKSRKPKGNNQASTSNQVGSKAAGRIYHLCAEAAVQDSNVVNGTFLINNVYASVLFDTSADRSFVSSTFSKYINITPTTLDTNYDVELADGKTRKFRRHHRNGLDVRTARGSCVSRKYIRVPYGNNVLIIQGEKSGVRNESRLEIISSIRTQWYIEKGCRVFLIQVTKKEEVEIPEKRIEDVPVVRDFLKVFPKDLPRLPPTRQCMSTRSSSLNLVPPFIDPESVIRAHRRNLGDPSRLLDFEEINMSNILNINSGPPPAGPPPQNHNGPPGPNLHMPASDL